MSHFFKIWFGGGEPSHEIARMLSLASSPINCVMIWMNTRLGLLAIVSMPILVIQVEPVPYVSRGAGIGKFLADVPFSGRVPRGNACSNTVIMRRCVPQAETVSMLGNEYRQEYPAVLERRRPLVAVKVHGIENIGVRPSVGI